jgi:hypothetical protein
MKLIVPQDSTLFWLGPRSLSSSRVRSLGFLESSLLHCMTCTGLQDLVKVLDELIEDHVWFEDRWMVASLCDE